MRFARKTLAISNINENFSADHGRPTGTVELLVCATKLWCVGAYSQFPFCNNLVKIDFAGTSGGV